MIIAIGGISRSGKSTLADSLLKKLSYRTALVQLDQFTHPDHKLPRIKNRIDWESPASIDWDALTKALQASVVKAEVVIIEGFLVFHNPLLCTMYHYSFLLQIEYTEFLKRRMQDKRWRHLEPQEPRWYIDHVWQSFLRFGKPPSDLPVIILPPQKNSVLLEEILNIIGPDLKLR